MTMLNGEPVDTGIPSTAKPGTTAKPAAATATAGGTPIRVGQGTDPTNRSMAQIVAIVALVMAIAVPPLGIVMGGVARSMLKPERSPLTTWAIVLGVVFTILWIIGIVAFIALMWWTTATTIEIVDTVTP